MIHFVLALASLIAAVEPALAHAPIKGIGVFYNGVLHLLFVPSQMLPVTALGLLLGQHSPQLSRCGWFAFVAAFWFGLAAGYLVGQGVPQAIFLALALIAGLMVAFEWAFRLVFVVVIWSHFLDRRRVEFSGLKEIPSAANGISYWRGRRPDP
jgi:hypothetical protein